jgi:hypothetical protein
MGGMDGEHRRPRPGRLVGQRIGQIKKISQNKAITQKEGGGISRCRPPNSVQGNPACAPTGDARTLAPVR